MASLVFSLPAPVVEGVAYDLITGNKRKIIVYVTTMYRWADREKHSYVVGVYDNETLALKIAESEEMDRGGKYSAEVLRMVMNEGNAFEMNIVKELE